MNNNVVRLIALLLTTLLVAPLSGAAPTCAHLFEKSEEVPPLLLTNAENINKAAQEAENVNLDFQLTEDEAIEAGRIIDRDFNSDSKIRQFIDKVLNALGTENTPVRTRKEFHHRIVDEMARLDEITDANKTWFNIEISKVIREMRKRRLKFQEFILEGDGYKASEIYKDIYSANQVATSMMINYLQAVNQTTQMTTDHSIEDKIFLNSTSQNLLSAITRDPNLKDAAKSVSRIYQNGRKPTVAEVLNVLDQVIGLTASEISYVEWYFSRAKNDPLLNDESKRELNYAINRLSPEKIASRFDIELLSRSAFTSGSIAKALKDGRPQIVAYWMKKIAENQRKHSRNIRIKSVFLLEKVKEWIAMAPPALRKPLMFLVRMDYNSYMIDIHMDSIEAILFAKEENRLQVLLNRVGVTTNKTKQLLETLARLTSGMDTWNKLRDEVKSKKDEGPNYDHLLSMMEEAEGKIPGLGFISMTKSPSTHDHIMGWVLPGGISILTLGYAKRDYLQEKWLLIYEYYTYGVAWAAGLF